MNRFLDQSGRKLRLLVDWANLSSALPDARDNACLTPDVPYSTAQPQTREPGFRSREMYKSVLRELGGG